MGLVSKTAAELTNLQQKVHERYANGYEETHERERESLPSFMINRAI